MTSLNLMNMHHWRSFCRDINQSPVEFAERILLLAKAFRALEASTRNEKIAFTAMETTFEPRCGTAACHGGWACYINPKDGSLRRAGGASNSYGDGIGNIIQLLGLNTDDTRPALLFSRYPTIWGNQEAGLMFSGMGYQAFGFQTPGVCTLHDISQHWAQVGINVLDHYRAYNLVQGLHYVQI
jgi:hypothetical protein